MLPSIWLASTRRWLTLLSGVCLLVSAVSAQSPSLSLSPAAVTFTYQMGSTLPKEQKVTIKQSTGAALAFTAAVSAGSEWLIVTPATGKTGTSISLYVNPATLLAGDYVATVTVDAAGSAGPVALPVTLKIRNAPPVMSVAPNALTFSFQTDAATPNAQSLAVSTNGEPASITATAAGGTWLSIDKATGIAVTGAPFTISAAISPAGLNPGSYSGKISISSTNATNKKIDVAVTLTVTAGKAVVASIWPSAAPIGSNDTTITVRGQHLFKDVSIVKAGAQTLTSTWISTGVMLATIPKSLLAEQGTLAITVTNPSTTASTPLDFTVTPPGPLIQAVVNAASFTTSKIGGNPVVSPGEMIAIFGSALGPAAVSQATPVCTPSPCAYPTSLGTPATLVEFELAPTVWTAAPLIFVQANQVNAVVPFAATAAGTLNMRVTYNALVSTVTTLAVEAANPGIFTLDSSGRGQSAALNYNAATGTYSLNSANNGALKGSIVSLYMTGGGQVTPAITPEGMVIVTAPALDNAVSVTIGGDGATVISATGVPGSIAGLVQLNITVPTSITAGKELPVVVTIAGRSSPATATLSVK
jgi:uncharacterized protein (TIGR03437 family)